MLLFIYSDKLPDIYEVMGSIPVCSFTVMVQHLLAAADLYNLDRLKMLCESKLCEEINIATVATNNTCPGRATPLSTVEGDLFEIYCKSDKFRWCVLLHVIVCTLFSMILQGFDLIV